MMIDDAEVYEFLLRHLQAIQDNDVQTYRATSAEDLTVYEWWVTPHRIDGLPFHEFMINSDAQRGTIFGSEGQKEKQSFPSRFDLSNLRIQRYGDFAIASYTFLLSTSRPDGEQVVAHNESRVLIKINSKWKVVHVHKSPAWHAPHVAN
jgi:ketosteroid isomerase-like protein